MAGAALELFVCTLERVRRELLVVECLDLERIGEVARIARPLWRSKSKLPGVNIPMTAPPHSRGAPL